MNTDKLWAVHVQGPDDVYACESKEEADETAKILNLIINQVPSPMWTICKATVIEWPYAKEEWLKELRKIQFVEPPFSVCSLADGGSGVRIVAQKVPLSMPETKP